MRHCVLCFFSSLLPGITKGFMRNFRHTTMMLQEGNLIWCPCSQTGAHKGAQGLYQKRGPRRWSGKLALGLLVRAGLTSTVKVSVISDPASKSQSSGHGRTEGSHILVLSERQTGGKDKISILCLLQRGDGKMVSICENVWV